MHGTRSGGMTNSKLSGKAGKLHCLFSEANSSTTNPQAKLRGCSDSAHVLYKVLREVCRRPDSEVLEYL